MIPGSAGIINKGESNLFQAGMEAFRNFLISIGMPKNFEELGAKEEDIPKLVDVLLHGDGRTGTIAGFVTLNEDDCTKIYKMMV